MNWNTEIDESLVMKPPCPVFNIFKEMAAALDNLAYNEKDKPVEDLTDMERLALCWNAGVDIDVEIGKPDQYGMNPIRKFHTRQKCAIRSYDGKYMVGVLES